MKKIIWVMVAVVLGSSMAHSANDAPPANAVTAKIFRKMDVATIDVDHAIVKGPLSKEQIAKVIAPFMGQVEYCYERELNKNPVEKSGDVSVKFVIDKMGKVAFANADQGSLDYPVSKSCMAGVFRRMPFPTSKGMTEATFTLGFKPAESTLNVELVPEKGIPAPQPVEAPKTVGSLNKDQIAKVIAAYMGQIEYCYERQIQTEPHLRGKIVVNFVIGLTGEVTSAKTESSTMGSPMVESCINGVFRRMPFPPPGAGIVEATYPLIFNVQDPKKDEKAAQKVVIKNEIAKVIEASMSKFNECYEEGLQKKLIFGKVIVWAMVDPKGNVTNVKTEFTNLQHLPTELCLNYQFSKLKFPEAANGKIVEVNYPFYFGEPKK